MEMLYAQSWTLTSQKLKLTYLTRYIFLKINLYSYFFFKTLRVNLTVRKKLFRSLKSIIKKNLNFPLVIIG